MSLAVWHPLVTGAAWLVALYVACRVVRWWTRETWTALWD